MYCQVFVKVVPEKILLKVLSGIEAADAGLVGTGMAQGVPMLHNFKNLLFSLMKEKTRNKIYYKLNV